MADGSRSAPDLPSDAPEPARVAAEANAVQAPTPNATPLVADSLEESHVPPVEDHDTSRPLENSGDVEPSAPQPPASPIAQVASPAEREPVQLPVEGAPPVSEIAGHAYRQQSAAEVDPAITSQEASQSAAESADGAPQQGTEGMAPHEPPARDSTERVTGAADQASRRTEDNCISVNGVLLPAASDAGADATAGGLALVLSEQPVDDAPIPADAAEGWQLLTVGFSYAPSRCFPGYIPKALLWVYAS